MHGHFANMPAGYSLPCCGYETWGLAVFGRMAICSAVMDALLNGYQPACYRMGEVVHNVVVRDLLGRLLHEWLPSSKCCCFTGLNGAGIHGGLLVSDGSCLWHWQLCSTLVGSAWPWLYWSLLPLYMKYCCFVFCWGSQIKEVANYYTMYAHLGLRIRFFGSL